MQEYDTEEKKQGDSIIAVKEKATFKYLPRVFSLS
jgi:hypothetical protein